MSSGGSNPSSPTGATGDQPTTATINSPIAKGPNAPEAPGGKGGFPAAQNPYSQQQPQVYMPPSQPTFYDQALNSPYSQSQYSQPAFQYAQPAPQYYQQQAPQYYQQQPQYYQPAPQITSYGLAGLSGSMGNAYARRPRFSPPSPFNGGRMSPIEAQPPMDEMQMGVMGGGEEYWRNKRGYGQFGGPGPVGQVMPGQTPGKGSVPEPMPGSDREFISYPGGSGLGGLSGFSTAPTNQYERQLEAQRGQSGLATNPAYMQQAAFVYGNSEEAKRNRIQRELNDAFTTGQSSGVPLSDLYKQQDELSNKLHKQYGLKPHYMEPG